MEVSNKNKNFFKIFIIYLIILVCFVLIRISASLGLFSSIKNPLAIDAISTAIIQIFVLLILPISLYMILFKKKPKQIVSDFGFKKLNFKVILICLGIGVLAFVLNIFVSSFFGMLLSFAGFNPEGGGGGSGFMIDTFPKFLYSVLSVAILPAICEEVTHRGLVLRGSANCIGYKKAIVLSALLFGLMHLNIQQFFYATFLGALMGLVATMTRSIYPAMIIHFCNNFINVYISYAEQAGLPGGDFLKSFDKLANSVGIIAFFIIIVLLVFFVIYFLWALLKKLYMEIGAKHYNKAFTDIEKHIREVDSSKEMTGEEVVEVFENFVFPNMKSPSNVVDLFIAETEEAPTEQISFKNKIPLIACFVLGILITIFTFIWGVV